jgi:hypothetical protein
MAILDASLYEHLQLQVFLFGFAITINLVAIGAAALSIFTTFCVVKLWRGLKVSVNVSEGCK